MPDAPPDSPPSRPSSATNGRKRKRDGADEVESPDGTDNRHKPQAAPAAPATTTKPTSTQPAKPTKKTTISSERYKAISNLLVMIIQRHSEEGGMKQRDLIHQYMNDLDGDDMGDDGLAEELLKVKAIIKRLITVDHVLIVVTESPDGNFENTILDVNPNYTIE